MGIFSFMFDERPGPGVRPDEPRKKGFFRFAEVVAKDFSRLYRAGALAALGLLPYCLGLVHAAATNAIMVLLPCSILGGMIAAPQISALADTVLRSLRNEPGFWWYNYCRAWKRDAKVSLLPGALTGLLVGMQVFMLIHIPVENFFSVYTLAIFLSIVLTSGILVWLWAQVPLLNLAFGLKLKNALLMFLMNLPRSLGASAIWVIYFAVIALLWPFSQPLLLIFHLWLPAAVSLLAIYIPLNENFHIEEELQKM